MEVESDVAQPIQHIPSSGRKKDKEEEEEVEADEAGSHAEHFSQTIDQKYTQYMEFAVYVFSGIVLIFLMEQFIQIGVALRSNV